MIKIITNLSNSGIQNQSFFSNNGVKISDWFQLILLTLIDASLSGNEKTLENLFISNTADHNSEGNENLTENSFKNNDEILKKNFLENLDQIKLLLAYLLENGVLETYKEDNLSDYKNYETLKSIFSYISKKESLNLENLGIDIEKLSSIEEIISQLLNVKDTQIFQLDQIFDNAITEVVSNSEEIDILAIKENLLRFLGYLNFTENNSSQLKKNIKNESMAKDAMDWFKINGMFNETENLIKTENNTNINIQQNVEKSFQQESSKPYVSVFHPENKYQNDKKGADNFSVLNLKKTSLSINEKVKDLNDNVFIFKNEGVESDILENKNLAIKNKGGFSEEINLYNTLDKKFKLETSLINRVAESNFVNISHTPENVIGVEDIKTVSFHKLPDEFFEIIKDMTFEIQPEGEKKVFIKLEPPDMGFLDLEIKTKNKDIEIIVRVEKPEVMQDIKNSLHHIRASLEESGLNLKNFQLFLGSGFDERALAKNFEDNKKYSYRQELEEIENKNLEEKELIRFYNVNGKYYYIA